MKRTSIFKIVSLLLVLLVGLFIGRYWGQKTSSSSSEPSETKASQASTWTCSMHPQIRQEEPGDCPICGMDLIPAEENASEGSSIDPEAIQMSETALRLADVQTAKVEKRELHKELYLTGKIQADERRRSVQVSHIPGRLEALKVNFEGERVQKGQLIASLYSPKLLSAQRELLEAQQIKESQPLLLEAAKTKLRNWKIRDSQIEEILSTGKVKEQIPLYADLSGYVLQQRAYLGDYMQEGQALYELADLSYVWVLFDIYESDLAWIKEGTPVVFTLPSLPGQSFKGKIQYIDPTIDAKERVAKARITLRNPQGKLKPQMLVRGEAKAALRKDKSLAIPQSAVLWTGKRSVVYVRDSSSQAVAFRLRNVELGPKLGDYFVVEKGLRAGETIAVNGTFSIDAAAQLADKPSMMRAEEKRDSLSPQVQQQLKEALKHYLDWKNELVDDDAQAAYQAAQALEKAISGLKTKVVKTSQKSLQQLPQHKDLEGQRSLFLKVSEEMRGLVQQYGPFEQKLFLQYCPMANSDKGGYWLSQSDEVRNPYFGASMLRCGEVKKALN